MSGNGNGLDGSGTATKPKSRSKLAIALWVLAGVVLVVATVVAIIGFQRSATQRAASQDLSEASRLVERADETVIAVDANVRASIDSTVAAEAKKLLDTTGQATDDLNAAISMIGRIEKDLTEDEAQQAGALRESAEARLVMLESARPILETNALVGAALGPADTGWEALLAADSLSKKAVAEYNKLTKDSVKKAKDLATQSKEKLEAAKTAFGEAEKAYPSADFSAYVEFCDAKLDTLVLARKAYDAFLADKPEEANDISDDFNAAEKKLKARAEKLPDSPRAVIGSAYETDVKDESAAYSQARAQATEADARYKELTD